MKSKIFGRVQSCQLRFDAYSLEFYRRTNGANNRAGAYSDYLRNRANTLRNVHDLGPRDGVATYCRPVPEHPSAHFYMEYREGPGDKAFFEAEDRKYLRELANPGLFLKELTPREELSSAEQEQQLGLDLSLPHHQNLRREFADEVTRILAEVREIEERARREEALRQAEMEHLMIASKFVTASSLDPSLALEAYRNALFGLQKLLGKLPDSQIVKANGLVTCLAVLPDKRIASGSTSCNIQIFNPITGDCENILSEHKGYIRSLAVSPDGRVVSGSDDKTIKIWSPDTGICEKTLSGHSSSVSSLAILFDGRIVSASGDKTIKIWNPDTEVCEQTLSGHSSSVSSLAILFDGRIVSASGDKTIKIWNSDTGVCEKTLSGHSGGACSLLVLSDGRIASGSDDKTIRVWNLDTGVCEKVLSGHSEGISSLAILSDGRIVSGSGCSNVSSASGTMKIWNLATGMCEKTFSQPHAISALVILPDGRIASGSHGCSVRFWGNPEFKLDFAPEIIKTRFTTSEATILLSKLTQSRTLLNSVFQEFCRESALTRDLIEKYINPMCLASALEIQSILATENSQVIISQLSNILETHLPKLIATLSLSTSTFALTEVFTAIQAYRDGLLELQQLVGNLPASETIHTGNAIYSVAALPDGGIVSGAGNGAVQVWNPATGTCEKLFSGHSSFVYSIVLLPDGRIASGSNDKTIRIWNLATASCEKILSGHSSTVCALALLPDGRIISGSHDKTMKIWNPTTGACDMTILECYTGVSAFAILPDGRIANGPNDGGVIKIFNPVTGVVETALSISSSRHLRSLAALDDGRIVNGLHNGTIIILNPTTKICEKTLSGHTAEVSFLTVLSDGRIVSGAYDNTVKIWNATTGACEKTIQGHASHIYTLAILPDGRVASGAGDGTIRLWGSSELALNLSSETIKARFATTEALVLIERVLSSQALLSSVLQEIDPLARDLTDQSLGKIISAALLIDGSQIQSILAARNAEISIGQLSNILDTFLEVYLPQLTTILSERQFSSLEFTDQLALVPDMLVDIEKEVRRFFETWVTLPVSIGGVGAVSSPVRSGRAPGDGNCFFHSVAMILGDTDHETLRARAVDYAIEHLDELAGFLDMPRDEFIERMTTPGEWADHVIIRALAGALTVNFVIHRVDGTINELNYSGLGARTLHLDYNGVHYDPHVVSVPHAAPVHAKEVPLPSDEPVPPPSREQRIADLMEAIAGGLHENVRVMIEADPTLITGADAQGNSLLQFAVIRGRDNIVQYLTTLAGIDIDHQNTEGHAAIHLAALHGRLDLLKHMMERGVDIDMPNAHGQTPLMLAESAGQVEVQGFIAGIKTPSMLRVWGGKYTREGATPTFVPVAKKEAGSSVGFVAEKEHTKPGAADVRKRWMAKFGLPDAEATVSETLTSRRRDLQRTVITSIKEKIAADVYTMLGHGAFYVPKHRLAKLPVINDFTRDNELAVASMQALNRHRTADEPQISHGVHIMSKWLGGYQDLEHLKDCVIGDTQADFMVFLQQGRIPETVVVDGKAVPLVGMMEVLATSRLLADADVLGGGGKNAGFVIERDATGAPTAVRVVKIDAGESFNFYGVNNQFVQSLARRPAGIKLSDKRDIQFGNAQPMVVRWELLSPVQQQIFTQTLHKGLVYLKNPANLDLLIQRGGEFDKAREDGRPLLQPAMIEEFKSHWLGYMEDQELPEVYGSLLTSVEPTPATAPVVAFAPQRFGAANMALMDAKSMGVDV